MNREIKFRSWDKKEKGWCVAFVISNNGEAYSSFGKIDSITDNIKYWKENVVIMQYTGLKDKNGVEIYEGDIGKSVDDVLWEIKYDVQLARFIGLYDGNVIEDLSEVHDSMEVIGNIYENPELLN